MTRGNQRELARQKNMKKQSDSGKGKRRDDGLSAAARKQRAKKMADEEHIRHCILYEFQLGRKESEAAKNICSAFGQDAVSASKCQRWFEKFREGNFSLDDKSGRGCVSNFDQEAFQALLVQNPQITQ
uniref:Small EDRK-rich factor 2 n=1 Tax=Pipistrellus kuhlii TaxID=59472 RepID=A0A7J8B5V1_PIPKU|nr:small EDRK-rich factor 2 [Pipistrellus kuhlii]